ncbi:MAG: chemotaxis protein CheW [Halobacteriota archaeon]
MPGERTVANADAEETKPYVIFRLGDEEFGVDVMNIKGIAKISNIDIEATPGMITTEIFEEYLRGVGKIENRLIILLDLKKVLTKEGG